MMMIIKTIAIYSNNRNNNNCHNNQFEDNETKT